MSVAVASLFLLSGSLDSGAADTRAPPPSWTNAAAAPGDSDSGLALLGSGDEVTIQVYGHPDMDTTTYVGDDGTVSLPLLGKSVGVSGQTPVHAAQRVEQALRSGQLFVDPHVTIKVVTSVSQRVAVLGAVRTPGRYAIAPNMTLFDLLAEAGGVTEEGADTARIERVDQGGQLRTYDVDLRDSKTQTLRRGDSVNVPLAPQFYIYGEVSNPNRYRLQAGMTVIEAVARAGGITPRGSERRIEIKRMGADGKYTVLHAKAGDSIQTDDVIRVKESIF